jgi:hypothetical protein
MVASTIPKSHIYHGNKDAYNLYKKLEQYGIKIKAGVGEVVAPSSNHGEEGEESPNSKGQDGR